MQRLPNLSALVSHSGSREHERARECWLAACGARAGFRPWAKMSAKDKKSLLHSVAAVADDVTSANGRYLTAYEQLDIDQLGGRGTVEHVVPRSHVYGSAPGAAEDDPVGWVEATQRANSGRSNLPLYLWEDPLSSSIALPLTQVTVDGEKHFVPPYQQRARLARKWLFIRATYDGIQEPSAAQKKNMHLIMAHAKHYPIDTAERRVNEYYRQHLGWANPLLEEGANQFYDDASWRSMVARGDLTNWPKS